MKRIIGQMRRAINDYNMIAHGDKVAVGVSGGKDSVTLLMALAQLREYSTVKFDIEAITLDCFEGSDFSPISELCKAINVNYTIKKTNIGEVVFNIRHENNPCSLCANLRRGALHNAALEKGCKKVALGHHFDDVLETFFLSLFYEGRMNCFSPVTYLDRKDIYLIRPFIYVHEKNIKGAVRRHTLPIVHNPCPSNGNTKRHYIKKLLHTLDLENKGLKSRLFGALQRSNIDGWKI